MAYDPILLEKTVIEDPFLFPDAGDNVLMFLGARASVAFDERVRDVRLSLKELERCDRWIKSGMPDEGARDPVIPTEAQIEQARLNTLNAIYHNEKVWGLYIHCRRADVDALFECADKVAAFLTARTPVKGALGQDFNLRVKGNAFGLRGETGEKPAWIDGEPETADALRDIISLSASFAAVNNLFLSAEPFPNQMFFPHVPKTMRRMLQMPSDDYFTLTYDFKIVSNEGMMTLNLSDDHADLSRRVIFPMASPDDRYGQSHIRIENSAGNIYEGPILTNIFFQEIFAPLMNQTIARSSKDRIVNSIEKHLDIFALARAGAIPHADFIKDYIAQF